MLALITILLQLLYAIGVIGLALYGFNALWFTFLTYRKNAPSSLEFHHVELHHNENTSSTPTDLDNFPTVTIQLPIFNELHVVERLIDACVHLEYPPEKLQIQVLDDSTDFTSQLIDRRIDYWRQRGKSIEVLRRTDRIGYKGGALAAAIDEAKGEFIAIFDADFKPPSDFLLRTVPHLYHNPRVGFIQARWTHLNADYSSLTRSQALALDGHFMIEQVARQRAAYAFGFNGSAGLWRRSCIEDPAVGGWQIDTLTEDLDLSYRAQLAGWQPLFDPAIEAPAEIPPQLSAFKRQQFRWAKGSIQTLGKCGKRVWQSKWPLIKKAEALIHLGAYLLHPMLLLILIVLLPILVLGVELPWILTFLTAASIGPPLLYAVAQYRLHPLDWWRRWSYIWLLTLLGFGICLNNSNAVWQALSGKKGPFLRTPKFDVQSTTDRWHRSNYRLSLEPIFFGELLCLLYALATVVVAIIYANFWTVLFIMLYVGGFGLMVGIEVWQYLYARFNQDRKPMHSLPTPNQ